MTCSSLVVAVYSVRSALIPGWLTFWVCLAGVAGKTALNPDSVATYGVAVGVGFVDELPD